ncbi:MAG: hydrolase [Candidatus Woesearchaeota archaeon]
MDNLGIIKRKKTAFLLIDLQEKFIPVIHNVDEVIKNSNKLIKTAEILKIPLITTEQYTKGLGKTYKKVILPKAIKPIEKIEFSCFKSKKFNEKMKKLDIKSLVIFGIEAHVCVLQTALDALKREIDVHIIADAVSSRNDNNKKIAIKRMRQAGAFASSTEMIIFQLLEKAGSKEFKEIMKFVK